MKLTRRDFLKGSVLIGAVAAAGTLIRTPARARQQEHEHHMPVSSAAGTISRLLYRGLNVEITEEGDSVKVKVNGRVKHLMIEKQRDRCYWSHLRPFDDGCRDAVSLVKTLIDMAFQGLFVLE